MVGKTVPLLIFRDRKPMTVMIEVADAAKFKERCSLSLWERVRVRAVGRECDVLRVLLPDACTPRPLPTGEGTQRSSIFSTTWIPNNSSPFWIVRAVRSQSSRRLWRSASLSAPEHVALLEKRRVAIGQVEKIGRELVGAIVGHGQVEGLGEAEQFERPTPVRPANPAESARRQRMRSASTSTLPLEKMLRTRA